MKLSINKKLFLQSWGLAERSTSSSSSMSILSSVLVKASEDKVTLHATDIRTSIICTASGINVLEPGEAVFPVKIVSELFKKAPGEEFNLTVSDGKVILKAGKSKYNFSTYPVREFPSLPTSADAKLFCRLSVGELAEVIEEGTLAASSGEEFPLYLSSANFQISEGVLNIVSTDTRRLALSGAAVTESIDSESALLPMKGIKEIQRILASLNPEYQVEIMYDDAQFYFKADNVEFTVRRVESHFPAYEKILPKTHTTTVILDRGDLISALERVDVIVKDYNRMVILDIAKENKFVMRGRAPDFGNAKEEIFAEISGDNLKIAVNSKFFMESLKVLREPNVRLSFNGSSGHMVVRRSDGEKFICLIAPINLTEEELNAGETEPDSGDGI
jgi:DNA polymerase-3 subunit beta